MNVNDFKPGMAVEVSITRIVWDVPATGIVASDEDAMFNNPDYSKMFVWVWHNDEHYSWYSRDRGNHPAGWLPENLVIINSPSNLLPADTKEIECHCKSLLFGHVNDCQYVKSIHKK